MVVAVVVVLVMVMLTMLRQEEEVRSRFWAAKSRRGCPRKSQPESQAEFQRKGAEDSHRHDREVRTVKRVAEEKRRGR